jgi:hypothetical protein
MSGGGGLISGLVKDSNFQGGRDLSMPTYGSKTVSPTANHYNPTYTPMQQNSQQTPLQQSPQQNVENMGLEALYQSMASQYAPISQQFNSLDQFYQQPMQQRQMPAYENLSLNYRPNMSGISANLGRVAPAVTREQMNPSIDTGGDSAPAAPVDSYA